MVRWILLLLLCALPARSSAEVLSSTKHPIRVHYTGDGQLAYAQKLLVAADEAWDFHVDGLKLPAPPSDAGARGDDAYDFVIASTPYGGVCEGGAAAAGRPQGITSHIVFDPTLPLSVLPLVSSHEFHHAVQAGICPFGNNLAEAGALYASGLHRRGQGWRLSYFLGLNTFQQNPGRALDWQGQLGDFYPYGGAAILSLLLGFVLARRWRPRRAAHRL